MNRIKSFLSCRTYVCAGFALAFGFFGGTFLAQAFPNETQSSCVSGLALIRPNLNCDISDAKGASLSSLETELGELVDGYKRTGKARRVGVFVHDLASNRFAGVHDNDVFYMASFLKVPVIIGGFKLAEVEPRILEEKLMYTGTPNLYDTQVIKPGERLAAGTRYSVRELMHRAIVYSDNTAAQLLFDYYPDGFMDRILQALGIQITRPTGESENFITARTYAGVFRTLYNSSYLTTAYSNNVLALLTQTAFRGGTKAKLPPSVTVAHKFAERTSVDSLRGGELVRQLHECGIVYENDSREPYTFCILTEGATYEDLLEVLQDVSMRIYIALKKE